MILLVMSTELYKLEMSTVIH